MYNIRDLGNDLLYIGCSDRRLKLFESAYEVPDGMSYNSYLLKDKKTVLFDTVDKSCDGQFFENLEAALGGRNLDYIIVHHMEPDHASLLQRIAVGYPNTEILCTAKAKDMIKQFFDFDIESRVKVVKEGETLNTGSHELQFIMAPMVHWPEVMVTYDKKSKVLFSADAFGSFGAINGNLFDDEVNWEKDYLDEARRYYTNIVGKYGLQVQMLLKKAASLDIKQIYPLHGLLIRKNINLFVDKYQKWSLYEPEDKGVIIAYTSVYGGTEAAVNVLAGKLADKGVRNIKLYDLSYTQHSKVLAEAFRVSHIILASTTYNAGIFESMNNFLHTIVSHNLQNRKFALIENGSWAPVCANKIKEEISKLKNCEILNDLICIKSVMKKEQLAEMDNVVNTIVKSLDL